MASKKWVIFGEDIFLYDDVDKEILVGLKDGLNSREIGEKVFRSGRNVEGRIGNMFKRSKTNKTISLVVFAIKNKIIEL